MGISVINYTCGTLVWEIRHSDIYTATPHLRQFYGVVVLTAEHEGTIHKLIKEKTEELVGG